MTEELKAQVRQIALEYAARLGVPGVERSAYSLVEDAKKIEVFLLGKTESN